MKKVQILPLLLMIGFGLISTVQASTIVPKAVNDAFRNKYPKAKKVEWEQEEDGIFEAEFRLSGKELSAEFKKDGTWLCTESELKRKHLPDAIIDSINEHFKGYKIDEVERIERPEEIIQYELELEKGKSEINAFFAQDGTLISQEIETEDD